MLFFFIKQCSLVNLLNANPYNSTPLFYRSGEKTLNWVIFMYLHLLLGVITPNKKNNNYEKNVEILAFFTAASLYGSMR
jgi:hypothetical protein